MNECKTPTLSVKYEDLLKNPLEAGHCIADFAQVSPPDSLLEKTLAQLDANRRFAFIESDELLSVYETIRSDQLVQKLGYGAITSTIS